MNTEIKPAIARSISHDEIVWLKVSDIAAAIEAIENDENVTELDHTMTSTYDRASDKDVPMADVWGTRLGGAFRLHITRES